MDTGASLELRSTSHLPRRRPPRGRGRSSAVGGLRAKEGAMPRRGAAKTSPAAPCLPSCTAPVAELRCRGPPQWRTGPRVLGDTWTGRFPNRGRRLRWPSAAPGPPRPNSKPRATLVAAGGTMLAPLAATSGMRVNTRRIARQASFRAPACRSCDDLLLPLLRRRSPRPASRFATHHATSHITMAAAPRSTCVREARARTGTPTNQRRRGQRHHGTADCGSMSARGRHTQSMPRSVADAGRGRHGQQRRGQLRTVCIRRCCGRKAAIFSTGAVCGVARTTFSGVFDGPSQGSHGGGARERYRPRVHRLRVLPMCPLPTWHHPQGNPLCSPVARPAVPSGGAWPQ